MNLLSRDDLKGLMELRPQVSASVYLPTPRAGSEVLQSPIRLKNLLREAEKQLHAREVKGSVIEDMLSGAHKLLHDTPFWNSQSDGLALFMSPGFFRYFRVPIKFDELVIVEDRFYVKPLLSLFNEDGRFFALAISKNHVRLLECTRHHWKEVELDGAPKNMAEALQFDDVEKQLQFRTAGHGGAGAALFHGHGGAQEDSKENLQRYFHEVDKAINGLLKGQQSPLILACVDYLFPIYRETHTYPGLVDKHISGNPDEWKNDELHEKAWAVLHPHFEQQREEASAKIRQLLGSPQASKEIDQILPAAVSGRVQVLFTSNGKQVWGAYDDSTGNVEIHAEKQPSSIDLVNLTAIHASLTGATIYAVEPQQAPVSAPMSAMFRY